MIKLYICPSCYKVAGCGAPVFIACSDCNLFLIRGSLPCQNYAEAQSVVKNLLCPTCKEKRQGKLN